MLLKKSFYIIFLFFLMFYLNFNFFFFMGMAKSFMYFPKMFFFGTDLFLNLDEESLSFIFMVSLVTSLVVLYSEFYMEHYNNKKFFFLMIFFFLSMIFLILSNSAICLMIGWDSLGVSSLFLIMFYPGKIPMFNSFITFFYNRLGDCLMIMILFFFMSHSSFSMMVVESEMLFMIIFLLIFCSFTKSAQLPLSSWLPAAMSAPTPISAMVHSSTLVTAGIFVIVKFFFYLEGLGFLLYLLFFSCATFLVGGVLGTLELDIKKIVAFSTMSQISMIIFFFSLGLSVIGFSHMIFHALFKTLLFCSCGLMFFCMFSDQSMKIFSLEVNSIFCFYLLFVSIFCMSGLPFSSSFFSKDIFMETCSSLKYSFTFFLMVLGSFLTILYSSKILGMISKSNFSESFMYFKKKSFFFFLFFFSLLSFFFPYVVQFFFYLPSIPVVFTQDLIFMMIGIFLPMILMFIFNKNIMMMGSEIFFSKFITFSLMSKFFNMDKLSFYFDDHLIFKNYLFFSGKFFFSLNFNSIKIFFMFLILCFVWFK